MYIKLIGDKTTKYSLSQLRKDNQQVSFPQNIAQDTLIEYGVYLLQSTEPPAYNHATQNLTETDPVQRNGRWYQAWSIVQASDEEVANRLTEQIQLIRNQRNEYLKSSDWTQGKDIPNSVSEAWAVHRQQLRDISSQPGFPYEITWPAKP